MHDTLLVTLGSIVLSFGTWLMRFGGAKLGNRMALSERAQGMLSDAATTLLFAVALATTLYSGTSFG
ncbi:AzlD domain-containing protein, partial [Leptospira borgpetersenii serovar Ballum]|nr:AzlD domain-containing protein [Leptospira borgpetersenii serovar Ballum]